MKKTKFILVSPETQVMFRDSKTVNGIAKMKAAEFSNVFKLTFEFSQPN